MKKDMKNKELRNNFKIINQIREEIGTENTFRMACNTIVTLGTKHIRENIDQIIEEAENDNELRIAIAIAYGLSNLEPEDILTYIQEQKGKYKIY